MEKVVLGMPGPWAEDNYEAADHFTTKVGGLPDWPTSDISPDLLKCRLCSRRMYFLAQVYAPVSSSNIEIKERTLYILGCPVPECASQSDGWTVLRVQSCGYGHQSIDNPQEEKLPSECSISGSSVTNWWDRDLQMQGCGEKSVGDDADMDLQALSVAISEAASQTSYSQKQKKHAKSATIAAKDCIMNSMMKDSSIAVLLCFYIYNEEERLSYSTIESQWSSLSIKDDHSDGDEKWEVESYEYDKALGADRTYLKFKKRMDAYPEQCIRYCLGGKPLLSTKDKGEPGACGLCGVQRQFEMQLMPPLLYYLQQAGNDQSAYSPQNWNWLTLIVYTCSKNCFNGSFEGKSDENRWTVSEEYISVQCE